MRKWSRRVAVILIGVEHELMVHLVYFFFNGNNVLKGSINLFWTMELNILALLELLYLFWILE